MLLMKLESSEKFAFLQLAQYLARVDDSFGEKEEEILIEYCVEMGIDYVEAFEADSFCLEENLDKYKSKKSQKIVLLELMILIHIDNNFHVCEQEIIKKITDKFKITLEDADDFSQWGKSVAMLYQVAKIFINEEKND